MRSASVGRIFIFQEDETMSFAENFRNARKNAGLTQQQVADVLGLDRSSIAQYERGVSKPNIEKILKICALFEISLDELILK